MADLTRNTFAAGYAVLDIDALLVAAAASQTVPDVAGKDFLIVKNGSGAGITLTLEEKGVCSFEHATTDQTFTVAAGKYAVITPANYLRFRDASTRKMELTWSATATVSVGLFSWPK